jgi:hypothetical protein
VLSLASISWDTWGLVAIGALVTGLWLFFRRSFPEDPPKR